MERSRDVRVLDEDAARAAGSKLWPGRFIEGDDGVVIDTAGTIQWPPRDPEVMAKVDGAVDAVAENGDSAIPNLMDALTANDPTIDPELAFRVVLFVLDDSALRFRRVGKPAVAVDRLTRTADQVHRVLSQAPVRPRSRERRERRPTRRVRSRSGSRGDPPDDPDPDDLAADPVARPGAGSLSFPGTPG